jgi:hypothetical protein
MTPALRERHNHKWRVLEFLESLNRRGRNSAMNRLVNFVRTCSLPHHKPMIGNRIVFGIDTGRIIRNRSAHDSIYCRAHEPIISRFMANFRVHPIVD